MDLSGKTLGQYEIIDQLGKGGMATVYRAYQAAMNRYVAIKVLPPQFMHDDTFVERFLREARVIANLNHRAILPIYDFGTEGDLAYIVMRLAEGGTLAEVLEQRGTFSIRETGRLVKQIASGLDYAHDAGVIHRDLKPQNVLVDAKGDVYLSDFGIAKVMETTAKLTGSDLMGTPTYMSPEQGQGAVIDRRADIYALGIMIYEMLTGKVPFTGETPVGIVYQHNNAPVPSVRAVNAKVPARVDAVVRKALAKQPEDRFKTAGACASAFETALLTRSWSGQDARPTEKPVSPRTRFSFAVVRRVLARSAIILAMLLVVALLVGGVAILVSLLGRPSGPEPVLSWAADLDTVWDIAFGPNGDRLATANADGTVRLFDPGTGQEVGVLRGHQGAVNAVAFRPDGEHIVTGGADGTVRVWWALTGTELVRLRGHEGSVLSVAYSSDGWRLATGGEDGMLRLWELRPLPNGELEGEEVTTLQTPGSVTGVAFSPDGNYLAIVGEDQRVLLSELMGAALPEGVPISLNAAGYDVAFDTGSDLLAVAGGSETVYVWNVRNREKTFNLNASRPLYGVVFSPDGTRVASAHEDGVWLWSLAVSEGESGEVVERLVSRLGAVCGLAYSPRGDYIAAASCDGRVHVWDMTYGGTVAVVAAPTQTPSLTPRPPTSTPLIPTSTITPPRTATPSPTPTETLAPTPVLGQGIARSAEMAFFEETFTNPASGWQIEANDKYSFQVVDGTMEVTVFEEKFVRWNWLSGDVYKFDDFVYSADMQLMEGENENYGLIFRRTEDDDFYMAQIIEGNVFEFWERRDGEWSEEPLLRVLDVESVKPPGEMNNMRIEAVGPWVSFFINGEMVGVLLLGEDDYLRSGAVGMFTGSLTGSSTIVARFDNVSVRDAGVLLLEDFSDEAGGWITEETDVVERGYEDDEYFIDVLEPGNVVWSFAADDYRNVVMEIDITYAGEADIAAYGLSCRRNQDNNMYEVHLFPDQEVVIWRVDDFGGRVALQRWTDVVPLEPGEARNILRMACMGDTIAVAVNGVYLGSVTDSTYQHGQVGLVVGSFEEGDVEVRFDNLAVTGR